MRRLLAVLVVGLCATLLSSCIALPESSQVRAGRAVAAQQQCLAGSAVAECPPLPRNRPPGPQPGASKQDVVQGYLEAMLAYPQSPDVVREFFTPLAAKAWNPHDGLVVYEEPTLTNIASGISLKGRLLGSLDHRGSWHSASGLNQSLNSLLLLSKVDGEWRIGNPPQGTLVDSDYFYDYYHQYSLYYFDNQRSILTPDPVFLLLGPRTATALVRNLLLGPTPDTAGVVQSSVPAQTTLRAPVSVSASGLAEVSLSRDVLNVPRDDLKYFAAQLAWTLRQERLGIDHVMLTVAGRPLDVPGVGTTFPVEEFQGYDPANFAASRSLFALSKGRLYSPSSGGVVAVNGPIGAKKVVGRSVGVDTSATLAAMVTPDGHRVLVGGINGGPSVTEVSTWFSGGSDILAPSWDVHDVLWLVDQTPTHGAVIYTVTSKGSHVVSAPGVSGEVVKAFALSRDGVRFAAVLGRGSHTRLVICTIRRTADDFTRVRLTHVEEIVNSDYPLSDLSGLAWITPTAVVVLAKDEGSDIQPYQVSIDGSRIQPTSGFLPIQPVSVASGPNPDAPTVLGARDGDLYIRTTNQQWSALNSRRPLFAPVYPG